MKKRKKLLIVCLTLALGGFVVAEGFMLHDANIRHQEAVAVDVYKEITDGFYAVEASIMAQEFDGLEGKIDDLNEKISKMNNLPYVMERDREKISRIQGYVDFLKNNAAIIAEFGGVKKYCDDFVQQIDYSADTAMDKNTLNGLRDKMAGFKDNLPQSQTESVAKITNKLGAAFDRVGRAAGELADCINVCYSSKMKPIIDGFNTDLNNLLAELKNVNAEVMTEVFNIVELDEILEIIEE